MQVGMEAVKSASRITGQHPLLICKPKVKIWIDATVSAHLASILMVQWFHFAVHVQFQKAHVQFEMRCEKLD